jgi:CheY-like chemotaxis protein
MNGCIAVVTDMIFASRITGTAEHAGVKCGVVRSIDALGVALEAGGVDMVLVDMHCDGVEVDEAIRMVKSGCPDVRVVAFYSHVQAEMAERASEAGADDVWPRSAFVQRLGGLFS